MKNRISVEDFRTIIRGLTSAYPRDSFIPDEYTFNLWYTLLQDISYPTLHKAALNYIMTNTFPPGICDMRTYAQDIDSAIDMLASQAWDLLLRALRNAYAPNSEEVWNGLPETIKQCVGGYATFRAWGNTELSALESVQRPMFVKRYESIQSKERTEQAVPESLRKAPLPAVGSRKADEHMAIGYNHEALYVISGGERADAPADKLKKLRERLRG